MSIPSSWGKVLAERGLIPGGSAPSVVVSMPPSYNNLYCSNGRGGRFMVAAGREWYDANLPILATMAKPVRFPVIVRYTILEWVRSDRDGSGMEKVLVDGLVKAGVLPDDSVAYVSGEDWRYRPGEGQAGVRVEWIYDPEPPVEKPKRKRGR